MGRTSSARDAERANSHLRIARPSHDLDRAERFWVDGLGLEVLYRTGVEGGDALLMLGWPQAAWHLELVGAPSAGATPSSTDEDLLVLFVGGSINEEAVGQLVRAASRWQHATRTGTDGESPSSTPTDIASSCAIAPGPDRTASGQRSLCVASVMELTARATIVCVGVDIREQRADDADEVAQVITAAFADGGRVAGLAAALGARSDNQSSLVAVDNGRIVGHTHLSISWVDAHHRLFEVLTLSPLSVAPERQSQGIGSCLLTRARETAEQLGAPLLFLEGDPGYYSKCGWVGAEDLGFTPPSRRIPAPAFQVIPLTRYDRRAMRGALVYNDTFWTYDSVGLRE